MLHLPATSLRPPSPCLPPLTRLPSTTALLYSRAPSRLRPSVLPQRANAAVVRCASISQVDNYGTVDFEKKPPLKWSALYRRVSLMEDPTLGAASVLEQWEVEQRKLTKWELCRVAKELRKFRRYKLALDVYDWIAAQEERYNFYSSDAAIMLDLISKVKGITSAEDYFLGLSEELKDKRTYGALLNAYTYAKMKGKAEAVLETMRNKGYATDALAFNVMMTLYMNIEEHDKVISIIKEMREKNIRLDTYSYNIWITTCAAMGDVEKMEQVLELMNSEEDVNANWTTYSTLATMHIRLGQNEKAEKCMKDAESRVTGRDRTSFNYLIGLYSLVGKKEEIYRIWTWYKSTFSEMLNSGYHSMLVALIKVADVDGAEAIYDEWLSSTSRYDPKICNILVSYYVKNGMMKKAEDCLERMLDQGGMPNPNTWELLAEGYITEKRASKALSCLKEAASIEKPLVKKWRPRPSTIAKFLLLCGEQNDRSSVESLIEVLRKVKCLENEEYKSLVSAHAGAALQEIVGAQG